MTHPLAYIPNKMRDGQLSPAELQANVEALKHAIGILQGRRYYTVPYGPIRFDVADTNTPEERTIVVAAPSGTIPTIVGATVAGTMTTAVDLKLRGYRDNSGSGLYYEVDEGADYSKDDMGDYPGAGEFRVLASGFQYVLAGETLVLLEADGTWAFDGQVTLWLRFDRFANANRSLALVEGWLANITTAEDGDAATAFNAAIVDIEAALADSEAADTVWCPQVCQSHPPATAISLYQHIPALNRTGDMRLVEHHGFNVATSGADVDHTVEDEVPTVLNTASTAGQGTDRIAYDENLGLTDAAPDSPSSQAADYRARQAMSAGSAANVSLAYSVLWYRET